MIKANWHVFNTKFSEDPKGNFEWFSYLLFCSEFDKPTGIFRYKNQSAIETNPIEFDGDVIGWQAKYYDTPLSKHKEELLNTLRTAKRDYPNVTQLHLYTNQEWSQNRGKRPQGLIEIETLSSKLGIEIVWKTASFFESEFVAHRNEVIASHFFSTAGGVVAQIDEQQSHTAAILHAIQTSILYKDRTIEIDRKSYLDDLNNAPTNIFILSGAGGVGKTVVVKMLYEKLKDSVPFYVFKASEFELVSINGLFPNTGLKTFVEAHQDEQAKIVVIDSAEKLLDLSNQDPFKEFLSVFIKNDWTVIFTTRNDYLEDLNYQFLEIYNVVPSNTHLDDLKMSELERLSQEYGFMLPQDEKMLELLRNPFYLNDYLKFYKADEELDYSSFKSKLWNKSIKKSLPERERCFLQVAFKRAVEGQFFVEPECSSDILDNELSRDGILGHETSGYFITHDIYEEWALERVIEREFLKKATNQEFFARIGESLPIRRSFRKWLSEKLLFKDEYIKAFIEEVISSGETQTFWKDEMLVSVLLSDYSRTFFEIFKDLLLENEQTLLKRLTFILRIACKEIDDDFLRQLGLYGSEVPSLKYVSTRPKGQGWNSLIRFIFDNLNTIGVANSNFVLPVINDWNSKFKLGETTKLSSLIALKYYQWSIQEKHYFRRENSKDQLLQTIASGASEIKAELEEVFNEIVENNWKTHRDPYYDLSKFVLTKLEALPVSTALPACVLELANLYWTYTPRQDRFHASPGIGLEQKFGVEGKGFDFFPASAYQTPIYWLLKFDLRNTMEFILNFTNKAVESFVTSGFAKHEIQTVDVFISENQVNKQYMSNRLWCIYRGTQASPNLLESIHMALEKYLLEMGKNADLTILSDWLVYLLKKSNSSSVSAVVVSLVLAYPEKTFRVAEILFRTKEFFIFDTARKELDSTHKSRLLALKENFRLNSKNDVYDDERIKSCDAEHRKSSLENLFLNLSLFRSTDISDEEAAQRLESLYGILDNYYRELVEKPDETDSDKTWRLYLARMDRRKMNPTVETTNEGLLIKFNPELEPELRNYSETSLQESASLWQHSSLRNWAYFKFMGDDEYKKHERYENNLGLALTEARDIINELTQNSTLDDIYFLFNRSIPASVCSVLFRDHQDDLSPEDLAFCKDVVVGVAKSSVAPGYHYQAADEVLPCISLLPKILELFPEEKEAVKIVLLLTLFNDDSIDMVETRFNKVAFVAIDKLWQQSFDDAQSLLSGFLLLRPRHDELVVKLRKENFENGIYGGIDRDRLLETFFSENEECLQTMVANQVDMVSLKYVEKLDFSVQMEAFKLLPNKTEHEQHKALAKLSILHFAKKSLTKDEDDEIDYTNRHEFLRKYAFFVLSSPEEDVQHYLKPFLENFGTFDVVADLLQEFVSAEDTLNTYDNFWLVWDLLKEKVFRLCERGEGYHNVGEIVRSYLFAETNWKKSAKDWRTFKERDKRFFREISSTLGHCESTLFSIAKLLNGIGSTYQDEGVVWTSIIIGENPNLVSRKLETNTVYYLENFIKQYIFRNRERIRRTKALKSKISVVLDFLIEKGSVTGYMLRENIV